jgi:ribosomal 50S subunit-associated protein YjgA (DUF615 family)
MSNFTALDAQRLYSLIRMAEKSGAAGISISVQTLRELLEEVRRLQENETRKR